jgi:hypothetical protein
MAIPFVPPAVNDINNPSKEIFAASGIYERGVVPFRPSYYAPDRPNSPLPNNGILELTVVTTPPPQGGEDWSLGMDLTGGNFFIDDMLVFNKYIHYTPPLKTFDPQSFLQESVVTFNVYNFGNRT